MSVSLICQRGSIVLVKGFRINKKQHDKLYSDMLEVQVEICAICRKIKAEKGVEQFNIHHTRYDVDPLDCRYTRFLCNSCNKDPSLSVEKIWENNKKNPLPELPSVRDPATPKTFMKGEIIDKKLQEYLPRRLMEESERTDNPSPKLLYEDFRADACNYCGCLPKAMDQHMEVIVAKTEGLYRFYISPKDEQTYVTWRE